jgi:acyl carrier protein
MTDLSRKDLAGKPRQDLVRDVVEALRDTAPALAEKLADNEVSLFEAGLDSLDHSALLLALEEKYKIKIPDADIDDLTSVNQIAIYLAGRISG